MAGLEVTAYRNEDNSVSLILLIPPRRNGEPNFGALARINRDLLTVEPAAFDPREDQSDAPIASYEEQAVQHHAAEAPSVWWEQQAAGSFEVVIDPALLAKLDRAESDDPQVGSLKAGEAESAA
jgi:hypothetical protein